MYNNNKTNLKEQFKFLVDYWIEKLNHYKSENLDFKVIYNVDELISFLK